LPGVAPALSAAFSATAVLFLLEALAKGTEKLSEWIANTFIMTQAMRDSNAAITDSNTKMLALNKIREEAQAKIDALTGKTKDETAAEREQTEAVIKSAEADIAALKVKIATKGWWDKTKDAMVGFWDELKRGNDLQKSVSADDQKLAQLQSSLVLLRAEGAKTVSKINEQQAAEDRQTAIQSALVQVELDKKVALAASTSEEDKFAVAQYYEQKKLSLLKELGSKELAEARSLAADIEAQQIEHAQKVQDAWVRTLLSVKQNQVAVLDTLSIAGLQTAVAFNPAEIAMGKAIDDAHALGITLKQDLIDKLDQLKTVQAEMAVSLGQDSAAYVQMTQKIKEAQKALDNFGQTEDKFKTHDKGMWTQFEQDSAKGATAMDRFTDLSNQAFDGMTKNMQSAFSQIVLGEGNVGKALEKATAQELATLASKAAMYAIFYTAMGFADLFTDPAKSSADFTAAAEFAAVAVASGAAGRLMSGAAGGASSGSNTNPSQLQNPGSNTSGSGSRGTVGVTGVQHFADGGLILRPTLATFAENGPEVAMPLNDPRAKQAIGDALGGSGGGTTHHWHIQGMISPDNLNKVITQINKRVARGQSTLNSSSTLRINKRSA
jgi:hypothetical protein